MALFKSLLAFGDSNVAGFESIDLPNSRFLDRWFNGKDSIEKIDELFKPYSFPNILADKLKISCENYAMSGSCNDRSLRLLTKILPERKNSLIIFGYTNPERHEFYYPDRGDFINRDSTDFLQVGIQWNFVESRDSLELNDLYLKKILRPYNDIDQKMLTVESISRYFDCEVIHLMLYPEDRKDTNPLEFDFQGKRNFRDWAFWKGFDIKPLNHFGRDAHTALAELLADYIDKKYP